MKTELPRTLNKIYLNVFYIFLIYLTIVAPLDYELLVGKMFWSVWVHRYILSAKNYLSVFVENINQ